LLVIILQQYSFVMFHSIHLSCFTVFICHVSQYSFVMFHSIHLSCLLSEKVPKVPEVYCSLGPISPEVDQPDNSLNTIR